MTEENRENRDSSVTGCMNENDENHWYMTIGILTKLYVCSPASPGHQSGRKQNGPESTWKR